MHFLHPKSLLFVALALSDLPAYGMEHGLVPSVSVAVTKQIGGQPPIGAGLSITLTAGTLTLTMPESELNHLLWCHEERPIFAACTRCLVIKTAARNARTLYANTFSTIALAARVDDSKQ